MKNSSAAAAMIALVLTSAGSAGAQCAFDGPAKAKGLKASLIRAFAACPSITFPAPNSSTGGGVPSCAPPFTYSPDYPDYTFADGRGECSVKIGAKLLDPCSDQIVDACMGLSITATCGVITLDTVTPIDDPGWSLNVITRATFDDQDNGDMTMIDFPLSIPFPPAEKGKLSIKGKGPELLLDLGLPPIPACSQLEVLSVGVVDPEGNVFARLGAGTRPLGF